MPVVALLVLLLGPAGCGSREPSDEEQVRDVLATFSKATETRDYQTICDDVFAAELLRGLREIGLPCQVAMRNSLGQVKDPKLTVGTVTIKGRTATAQVRTTAQGQQPSSDELQLVKRKDGWKVKALGRPPAS
jgi:hypothetical protein